jgi:hypothetical protein
MAPRGSVVCQRWLCSGPSRSLGCVESVLVVLLLVASEVLKFVEAAARATHECAETKPVKLLGGSDGAQLADRDCEHDEVEVLPAAELRQLIGREIGTKMVHQPDILAQADGGECRR